MNKKKEKIILSYNKNNFNLLNKEGKLISKKLAIIVMNQKNKIILEDSKENINSFSNFDSNRTINKNKKIEKNHSYDGSKSLISTNFSNINLNSTKTIDLNFNFKNREINYNDKEIKLILNFKEYLFQFINKLVKKIKTKEDKNKFKKINKKLKFITNEFILEKKKLNLSNNKIINAYLLS